MQGTAAVALAAVLAGLRAIGGSLDQQTFLFLGAGEAGTGEMLLFSEFQYSIRDHSGCYSVETPWQVSAVFALDAVMQRCSLL